MITITIEGENEVEVDEIYHLLSIETKLLVYRQPVYGRLVDGGGWKHFTRVYVTLPTEGQEEITNDTSSS